MADKTKICIVTQSHLCRNPRVLKEATTLALNNYDVVIVTGIISQELYRQDIELIKQFSNIKLHIVSDLSAKRFPAFLDKAARKAGKFLVKYIAVNTPLALGYGSYKYYKACREINADLYICHQEMATYTGNQLIKAGYKVAFDFEDWYAEDLLPEARQERPLKLLRKSEIFALKNGAFSITTSFALANALSDAYSTKRPGVIYNVFPSRQDLLDRPKDLSGTLKLFWFSQTIGEGRGLEQFITMLAHSRTGLELHLLGSSDAEYRNKLKALISPKHGLFFHGLVDERQLPDTIAQFDIGLALELDTPPSRNYTITNKFFQYLQAGLPVIATRTAGQVEAFKKFKPGFQISQQPSAKEIGLLEKWLSDPAELQSARQRAVSAAGVYNWESEAGKLITLVKTALEQ